MAPKSQQLAASIVLFQSDETEVRTTVFCCLASKCVDQIYLIDNSPDKSDWGWADHSKIKYIFNDANLGYGTAHNIALRQIMQTHAYALVLNADVSFEPEALDAMVEYMENRQDVGLLSPKVLNEDGSIQHSVRLLPTPINLIARRFFLYGGLFGLLRKISPAFIERHIAKVHEHFLARHQKYYELGFSGYSAEMSVQYVSGCFMFIRTEVLKKVGLFDERYFMYPEDIDLSRRISSEQKVIFSPLFQVTHGYGGGSYKSPKLLYFHITSMVKYFNKWGWLFDGSRKSENQKTLQKIRSLMENSKGI